MTHKEYEKLKIGDLVEVSCPRSPDRGKRAIVVDPDPLGHRSKQPFGKKSIDGRLMTEYVKIKAIDGTFDRGWGPDPRYHLLYPHIFLRIIR